jgi:hypothetical protein
MKRVALIVFVCCLLVGCHDKIHVPAGTSKQDREYAINYLDSLYWKYLHEDVNGARAAMIEAITYSKQSPIPELKESPLGYWRLSVLEKRVGDFEAARVYFLRGQSVSKAKTPYTEDECERIVTHWDETHLKGGSPHYLDSLKNATNHVK